MDKIKNAVGKLVFQFSNGIFNFILHSQFQHDFNFLHAPKSLLHPSNQTV